MSNLFEWDELTVIRSAVRTIWKGRPTREQRKEFCDWLEFVLCYIYAYGWEDAEEAIGTQVRVELNGDTETVNLEIAGLTFRDRIMNEDTAEEVLRVVDTEAHRVYNAGVYNAAKASGNGHLLKKWMTMRDDKVRDSHRYLDGMVVGLDDLFYTEDGDCAMYPGGFELPENNVNCRCFVTLVA